MMKKTASLILAAVMIFTASIATAKTVEPESTETNGLAGVTVHATVGEYDTQTKTFRVTLYDDDRFDIDNIEKLKAGDTLLAGGRLYRIKEKTEEIWGKIKDFFVTLWEVIKYLIELKIKQIKDKVVEIANNIVEKFKLVKTTVITLFEAIKSGVLQKIDNIKNGVTEKFNAIKDTISGVIDFVKRLFRGEIQFPHIKMPHFSWSWTDLGVVKIPNINVDWYARGGIVDKPTLIGAGEAGREAIVPLERNTEWIRRVADELADILTDRLGSILQSYPMPAVASGALIPPKIEVDIDGLDAIDSKLAAILDRMGSRGGSYSFTAQLNRKTLFQEVINEAKIAQSTTGRNPFELR